MISTPQVTTTMKYSLLAALALAVATGPALAQMKEDPDWVKQAPTIGDNLPDLIVYSADGKEFKTSSLHGHYTVLDFGCLT